jgi:hypothetical protein
MQDRAITYEETSWTPNLFVAILLKAMRNASSGDGRLRRPLSMNTLCSWSVCSAGLELGTQDEGLFRGEILNPHGEEPRLRGVSNHVARDSSDLLKPCAIALQSKGTAHRWLRHVFDSAFDTIRPQSRLHLTSVRIASGVHP